MAISLTELLDTAYQFDLDLSHLETLVEIEKYASHWQETVQFLDILYTHWPRILSERGEIDPMDRTIRLIRSFTKGLQKHPDKKVVLAGFTDVFPALTELINVVSKQKDNLILKENDISLLSQHDYTNVHHPQEKAIIEAITKDSWKATDLPKDSFKNIRFINADTTTEEALTIALILRQTLETPNKRAALVTTDRTLARQVISQMERWHIQLDDSAGTPLHHTNVGTFFSLIADLGINPSGVNYLALLKHPLSADGDLPMALRQKVQKQEKGLRQENAKWNMPLHTDFSNWISLFQNNTLVPFGQILRQHIEIAEQLAKSSDKTASERLWQNDAGTQMFQLITELLSKEDMLGSIEPKTYPEILKIFMQSISVRPKYGMHPRLDILGPIESRFSHPDVCIIGGLNEGVFPPLAETGAWLNRPMRKKLGLPAPEEKIKELAMDFAHNFCSPEVYMTRAIKIDGAQAVPSRFVERLKAVAQINGLIIPEYKASLAKLLDQPESYDSPERPAPCPPLDVRPNKLPVTQIEMWRRNPYAIYARYILKLFPLQPIESMVQKAEFGTLIHEAIATFLKNHPKSTDRALLIKTANDIFNKSSLAEVDKTFLQMQFSAIADFLIEQQKKDIDSVKDIQPEQKITHSFDINGKAFELYGTADRIDLLSDDTLRVIDYKTYHPPKNKEVIAGFSPQLVLEALLLNETQDNPVSTLAYWYLSNKKEASETQTVVDSTKQVTELIQKAKDGLFEIVTAFRDEKTPYEVCPIPSQSPQFNDYAHLARMAEWIQAEEEE